MTASEKIDELLTYPSCAHLSPPYLASILKEMMGDHHLVNLGSFERSGAGEAAAADISVCGNANINQLIYRISSTNHVAVIYQVVVGDRCAQTLLLNGAMYYRGIFFTDDKRTAIREVGGWD